MSIDEITKDWSPGHPNQEVSVTSAKKGVDPAKKTDQRERERSQQRIRKETSRMCYPKSQELSE